MPDWIIERLADHHGLADFDCGKQPMSDWLIKYALQNQAADISRTYVALRPGTTRAVGYYSLSSTAIRYEDLPRKRSRRLPRQPVPAALLGRLAVDRQAQGQRLGEFLLLDALARTQRTAAQIATYAVVVDVIDDQARGFYLKYGFDVLLDDPHHLFMPMSVIRELKLYPPTE